MTDKHRPLRLYSHEIAFHTPYLAMLAKEATVGFSEARQRFTRVEKYADFDTNDATLIEST